jgi:hypothetical protein
MRLGGTEILKRGRPLFGLFTGLIAIAATGIAGSTDAGSSTRSTIATGPGTAIVTWKPISDTTGLGNPPQPFKGTIEGIPMSGLSTSPFLSSASSSSSDTLPSTIELYQWKGQLGDQPFDIGFFATFKPSTSTSSTGIGFPSVTIKGTWGSRLVNGRIADPTAAQLKSGKGPVHFYGTIGKFKVSGAIKYPSGTGNGKMRTGTATFNVTR